MTEGVDDLSINVLNANTEGMIKHRVDQLQRQTSFKKQQSLFSNDVDDTFFKNFLLHLERADSAGIDSTAHPVMIKTSSMPPIRSMRRATSYCGAQTQADAPEYDSCGRDIAEALSSGSTLTAKHRHLLQARQAWIKYQIQLTNSTAQSFKQQR